MNIILSDRTQTGQFIRYPGQPYSHTHTNKLDIRSDILERLTRFHGNPSVWWVGQVLRHLLHPNEELLKVFNESSLGMNNGNPHGWVSSHHRHRRRLCVIEVVVIDVVVVIKKTQSSSFTPTKHVFVISSNSTIQKSSRPSVSDQ